MNETAAAVVIIYTYTQVPGIYIVHTTSIYDRRRK